MVEIDKLFKSGTEGHADLMEIIEQVPLVSWMISKDRSAITDMTKDSKGRVIVNITKPHILENMSYFNVAANTFRKTGKYCEHYPSKNPDSPYRRFWDEEIRRCKEGYIRPDGEWVTGYHYYYLNYTRIWKTVIVGSRSSDGSVKSERIEDFPDMWDGDYLFFHYIQQAEDKGKYGAILKARGKGYSFKLASMLQRNYFLFKGSKSYALAADSEYLDADGILNKADDNFSFITQHAGFAKKLVLKDTIMHKKAGYKKPGDPTEYGVKSERIGITLKNKPDKARGKRGKLLAFEESGSFPHLIKSWTLARKSLEDGNRVFGMMVAFGTGGEEGSSFQGLEQLFYKPRAFRVYDIPNVFDRNPGKSVCALFVPDYLNRADCYDKDGNSDVLKALGEVITNRLEIKYNSDDSSYIAQAKAEEPITPQEAVMRTQHSEFPRLELTTHLAKISPIKESFVQDHYIIDITWVGNNAVEWKPVFDKHPIREYPYKGRDITGAIEVFEIPKLGKNGQIPRGRYIIGCDPIDDDTNLVEGISLFNVWVFDLWDDVFVAEYTGRYPKASDNYEIAAKLAVMYNAEINYENKLKGMFEYFNRKNLLSYLMDTPQILKDMDYIKDKNTFGNKSKGSTANPQINAFGRRAQAEWMLTKNESRECMGYETLRSFGYIKECISWNLDGNFDRVSGAIMIFIARADRFKMTESAKKPVTDNLDVYANDEFFKNNYTPGRFPELAF